MFTGNGSWYEEDAVDRIREPTRLQACLWAGPGCCVTTDRGAGSGDPKNRVYFLRAIAEGLIRLVEPT